MPLQDCLTGYQIILTGQLVAAPASSGDNPFPAGSTIIPFVTNPNPKPVNVSTGDMQTTVNSGTFVTIVTGVTQGTILFLRTASTMQVRTTTYNVSGNVVAVEVVNGLKLVEYDPGAYLVSLEVLGAGAIEYFVGGPQ